MISKSHLEVQIYFDQAVAVSSQRDLDQVVVQFNDASYFRTDKGQIGLQEISI
jgi:hypothetical protein